MLGFCERSRSCPFAQCVRETLFDTNWYLDARLTSGFK